MKIRRIVAVGALALAVGLVQPTASFAYRVPTPPAAAPTTNPIGVILPMAWAVGVFICTGLTWGKMKVDADKAHRELTGADAFRGIGRCLFPPAGFARLMQDQ